MSVWILALAVGVPILCYMKIIEFQVISKHYHTIIIIIIITLDHNHNLFLLLSTHHWMQAGLNVTRLFRLERFATPRLESPSGFTLQKRFSCETMICKMQNANKVLLQDDHADLQNIGSQILSVFVNCVLIIEVQIAVEPTVEAHVYYESQINLMI